MTYIPKGCDQQGRLETGKFADPDDWDAAGVAEEGKSGTRAIGMVITAVIVAAAVLAVFA